MADVLKAALDLIQTPLFSVGHCRFGNWADDHNSVELVERLKDPQNQKRLRNAHLIPKMIQRRLSRGSNIYDKILKLHLFRYSFLTWKTMFTEGKQRELIKIEKQKEKRKRKKKELSRKKEILAIKKKYFNEIEKCQNLVGKLMIQIINLRLQIGKKRSTDNIGNLKLISFSEKLLLQCKKEISVSNPVLKVLYHSYANRPILIEKMNHWELTINMSDEQITNFGEDCHLVISREKIELLINSIGGMYIKTLKKNMITQSFSRWKIISKLITAHQKNQLIKEKEKKKEERIDNRATLTEYDEFMHSEFLRRKGFEESCLNLD